MYVSFSLHNFRSTFMSADTIAFAESIEFFWFLVEVSMT